MSSYATYTYYTNTYLGTLIASADFARLALRASAQIDRVTFDRVAAIVTAATDIATIDKITMATCNVAETLQAIDAAELSGVDNVKSESVGSYSVSYATIGRDSSVNASEVQEAAALYLMSTGLLFRGFASEEYGGETSDDN